MATRLTRPKRIARQRNVHLGTTRERNTPFLVPSGAPISRFKSDSKGRTNLKPSTHSILKYFITHSKKTILFTNYLPR